MKECAHPDLLAIRRRRDGIIELKPTGDGVWFAQWCKRCGMLVVQGHAFYPEAKVLEDLGL